MFLHGIDYSLESLTCQNYRQSLFSLEKASYGFPELPWHFEKKTKPLTKMTCAQGVLKVKIQMQRYETVMVYEACLC